MRISWRMVIHAREILAKNFATDLDILSVQMVEIDFTEDPSCTSLCYSAHLNIPTTFRFYLVISSSSILCSFPSHENHNSFLELAYHAVHLLDSSFRSTVSHTSIKGYEAVLNLITNLQPTGVYSHGLPFTFISQRILTTVR